MRKFVVNVNGKQYEVEVEEVGGAIAAAPAPAAAPAAPKAAPAPVAAPAPAAAPKAAAAPAGAKAVKAPMPGTIVDVKVAVGQQVKGGQVLAILEAMKMENEIMADADGTVASVAVSKGSSVNSGDVILTLN